jgi:cyclic-di-AMP phosphodiesterase PgpH
MTSDKKRSKGKHDGMPIYLMAAVVAIAVLSVAFHLQVPLISIIRGSIYAALIVILIILYIDSIKEKDRYSSRISEIFVGTAMVSLPGILFLRTDFMPLLLTGVVFTTVLLKKEAGIFYTIIQFLFLYAASLASLEDSIFLLVTGILISLLTVYRVNFIQLIYKVALVLSFDVIMLLINCDFIVKDFINLHSILTLGSVLAAIVLGETMGYFYLKRLNEGAIQDMPGSKKPTVEEVIKEDFILCEMLKESEKLYEHSRQIAIIAEQAAAVSGLDKRIAKAGGLYHEIGKLKGKDYVAEGLMLAKTYQLPEAVINIIASHNLKTDKPTSPEGALVMFTVSLVAAKEYFLTDKKEEQTKEEIAELMEKFTSNLFTMRLEKESLMNSGLTVKQYIQLKKFFLNYFTQKEATIDTEYRV